MSKSLFLSVIAACLFILFLPSCGNEESVPKEKTPEEIIVGIWSVEIFDNSSWIEFKPNKIVTTGTYASVEAEGTWEFNGKEFMVSIEGNETPIPFKIVNENQLFVSYEGFELDYHRIDNYPKEEQVDILSQTPEKDSLQGIILRTWDLQEKLKTIQDGDTLSFAGVIEGPINLKNLDNITLMGNNNTFLFVSDNSKLIIELEGCSNIKIEGFYMTHHPSEAECQEGVIQVTECDNIEIINNDISGSGYFGVRLKQSNDVLITNNVIHDCSFRGINFYDESSENILIENNTFYHNGWGGDNHIGFDFLYNKDSLTNLKYEKVKSDYLAKNKVINHSLGYGYVYAKEGLEMLSESGELMVNIPFKAKVKIFPLGIDDTGLSNNEPKEVKRKIEYNNQIGWVNQGLVSRFPVPDEPYESLDFYLQNHCQLVYEKHFTGHSDGEAYMDITVKQYKEGVCWIDDQGWEWGAKYVRFYNMDMTQGFYFAQNALDEFSKLGYPSDDKRHNIDSTIVEGEMGYMMRSAQAFFNYYGMYSLEVTTDYDMWGSNTTVRYFNGDDILFVESHGM